MQISFAQLPQSLLLALLALIPPYSPGVSALHGDSWCGTLMCVQATINASTVTYELKSLNQLGWMAIGFGSQMANTPMVILWPTPNGTIILSQRQASGRNEPLPVTHPPRVATVSSRASSLSGVTPVLAFDIPKNNETIQSLIWAFGVSSPDADPTADIVQHLDAGTLSLNLTKELDSPGGPSSPTSSSSQSVTTTATRGSPSSTPSQPSVANSSNIAHASGLLIAHAALSATGFLILLPLGTLIARFARVFTSKWFTAHWFVNVVLGIPLICLGWALGPLTVAQEGGEHVVTAHLIGGVVLFVLYIIEVALGTVIHMRRPKDGMSHPPRNVMHVLLGLMIFGLSIYETVNGIDRDPFVNGPSQSIVIAICIAWAAVFAGSYSLGLLYLRRQFAQERLGWNVPSDVPLPLPIIAPLGGMRASSESVRRRPRTAAPDNPMADDGTHDVFSEPYSNTAETPNGEVVELRMAATEMRQVQAAPVSLSAFW